MNYSKEELVSALGIDALDDAMKDQALGSFLRTLEMRTGQAVADALSEDKLDEFNKLVDDQGDDAAESWLRQAVPGYEDIDQQQCDILIAEIQATGNFGE